jgi:hypothetical protein
MGITLDNLKASLHSVAIETAGGNALGIDASGKITAIIEDGGGSITVDGTVAATQSGTWTIDSITNTVAVSATDLDIRDLTHVSDSVKVGDGTDFLAINADGSINAQTVPGGFASWKVTQQTIDTTAGGIELAATPLASRLAVLVQNVGSNDVYVKEATGVTSSNGFLLPKGSSYEASLDDGADLWAIAGSGSTDIRIVEYAA